MVKILFCSDLTQAGIFPLMIFKTLSFKLITQISYVGNSQTVRVTLRLAVYRQSIRFGDKPHGTQDQ
jgi:hypothetical protein